MRYSNGCVAVAIVLLSAWLFLPGTAAAGDAKGPVRDKALCAEMIRFGLQSYQRSKYLDAKEYFRKAIQADPSSADAWRHYDLAVVYALAEKVNKDTGLIAPDVSPQGPAPASAAPTAAAPAETAPPSPPPPAPAKKPKFTVESDEGC